MALLNANENHSHLAAPIYGCLCPSYVPRGTIRRFSYFPSTCFFSDLFAFYFIFGAGAPVVSQRLFLHGPQKRVTNFLPIGRVFSEQFGAGAPVVGQRLFSLWCSAPIIQ